MGAIGNINKNITPKARVMIALASVSVVGIVGISVMRMGGDGSQVGSIGIADLSVPPSREQISKDKPTDAVRFGEGTVLGEIYKDEEKNRAKEAEQTGASHVDTIKIELLNNKEPESEPEPVVTPPREPSKLELLMAERRKAQNNDVGEVRSSNSRSANPAPIENPWKNYLDAEIATINDYESSYSAKVGSFKRNLGAVPLAGFEQEADKSDKSDGSRESQASAGGYSQYLSGSGSRRSSSPQANVQTESVESKYSQSEDIESIDTRNEYPSDKIARLAGKQSALKGQIHVGDMFYSILQIGVNTDELSPVRAVSVDKGPLEGATFVGSPARNGQKATIEFTNMSIKGRSYRISAIAVDPDTYRSGLADSVDNHVLSRYTKLAFASFVDGYANALSSTQTVTNTDGSTSSISNPLPKASDQARIGIGKVGEKLTPIFEREFDRPPTVTIEENRGVIIMFMQELDLSASN